MMSHLGHGRLDAVHVICSGTGGAVYHVVPLLTSAHQAVFLTSSFVDALVTIPVTLGYLGDGWLETVSVVALVTTITQQQRILILTSVTELTRRLHDRLVPGDGGLQDIEGHGQLSCVLGVLDSFSPGHQTSRKTTSLLLLLG